MSTPSTADERVADLLAGLSRAELVACCHQHVPALPRPGLAAFSTGTAAAHGLAWLGRATVFPQPVGLAASWDVELLRRVGEAVGTEVRARHAQDPSVSLNVWAPVVNPLRHPRWGRTEEGFSEDPWLTARLATGYARGLRGDHPRFWRTVPTLKHVLAYSNETDRDVSSSAVRPRILHEYELPAFLGPLRAGVVGALMPSYNLVNARPAHLAAEVLDLLRESAPHPLLVVSDAYAPTNLAGSQGYCRDHVEGWAAALRAGVDSFTDGGSDAGPTMERLSAALRQGLVTEADLERAAGRMLHLRALTGELDPADDPYAAIGPDALDTPAHRALARESTARSAVLLANPDGLLPLRPTGSLVVVGPFATRVLHDWYSGTPPYTVGLAEGLAAAWSEPDAVAAEAGADVVTLRAVTGGGLVRADDAGRLWTDGAPGGIGVRFAMDDWGHGLVVLTAADGRLLTSPDGRTLTATAERVGGWEVQESFRLRPTDDGRVALWHRGTRTWVRRQERSGRLELGAAERSGAETFVLSTVDAGLARVAAAAAAADVVVVTAGNEPHLHGRETEDRPDLWLPDRQRELLRVARAANPRCVLVVVSSYPYVLDADERTTPAVLWSSHAGQELGHGLADVLTGAVEPSGRLAQGWPADPADVGPLFEYDLLTAHQTYGYGAAPALYPFGHGLGYGAAEWGAATVTDGVVSVELRPGPRPSEEVVQVYAHWAGGGRMTVPDRLAGFARVSLPPVGATGESDSVTVAVELDPERLMVWDVREHRLRPLPGRWELMVGRSYADVHARLEITVDGPEPTPWRLAEQPLRAADFDDHHGADLVPDTLLHGEAVTPRPGHRTATLDFWAVDLGGRSTVALRVRGGAVTVGVLTRAVDADGPFAPAGAVAVEAPTRTWQSVEVVLAEPPSGPVDLRLEVPSGLEVLTLGGTPPELGYPPAVAGV